MSKRSACSPLGMFVWAALLGAIYPGVCAAQELSVRDVVKKAAASVVYIDLFDKAGDRIGGGSGFFIAPHRVLTNAHVVDELYSMQVVLRAPQERVDRQPKILKFDNDVDLALLEVGRIDAPPLPIDTVVPVEAGQPVVVYGNDYEGAHLASEGIVRACLDEEIVLSAAIHPGHSGCPVLNMEGRVMGIVARSYTRSDVSNMGFAIPLSLIQKFMKKPDAPRSFPWAGESLFWPHQWKAIWGFVSGLFGRVFKLGFALFGLYLKAASIFLLGFIGWRIAKLVKKALKSRKAFRGAPAPAARPLVAYFAFAFSLINAAIAFLAGLGSLAFLNDADTSADALTPAAVSLVAAFLCYVCWPYYRHYRPRQKPRSGESTPVPAIGSKAPTSTRQGLTLKIRLG